MFTRNLPENADIVIIGGGVVGCAIARELSKYKLDIVLIEKEADVGWGASKANLGMVHAFVLPVNSLKGKLCIEGNKMFDKISKELDVPFKRIGMILVALNKKESLYRVAIYLWAKFHRIPVKWITKRKLRKIEPNLTKEAQGGILFPTAGITSPYELTIAFAENATMNGVKIVLETKVIDILVENNEVKGVVTDKGTIKTKIVINAAGVYSDEIAKMAGAGDFEIHPYAGTMIVFDKRLQGHYNHIIREIPLKLDPRTKGGGAAITVDGNPIWGPNLRDNWDKENTKVTKEDIETVFNNFAKLFPAIKKRDIITFFAGLRAAATGGDFIIRPTSIRGFINVAGIQSPGLTASPAIAKMVEKIVEETNIVKLEPKENFNPFRKSILKFSQLSNEEKDALIKQDRRYGHIICRCELITEAEIIEAIKRGATTLDGIKFRVRAGMGRCQGGFCTPRIIDILSKELKVTPLLLTKKGDTSYILCCETKSENN